MCTIMNNEFCYKDKHYSLGKRWRERGKKSTGGFPDILYTCMYGIIFTVKLHSIVGETQVV